MNEKVAHALQKGKEIAVPLCLKGKELALKGYAKGNELMDKVSFLQKPLHKKIVWGVLGLVFLWMLMPSGCGRSSDVIVLKEGDFKKESSSKEMFYVKDGKDDGFMDVVPNLKRLPKMLSLNTLCGGFNPELEEERHKKGVAYLNDENNYYYHCIVIHAGDGFVIAEPNDKGMYGDFCGYIETDDEYVDGQQLKTGFYALTGKKKVPLPNGATRSMYAFKQLDYKSNKIALDAIDYNGKAEEAAKKAEKERRAAEAKKNAAKVELVPETPFATAFLEGNQIKLFPGNAIGGSEPVVVRVTTDKGKVAESRPLIFKNDNVLPICLLITMKNRRQ